MEKRYPTLNLASSLLKTISILVVVVGVGGSLWFAFQDKQVLGAMYQWAILLAVFGILASVIVGVLIYVLSDLFRCLTDIESNTRETTRLANTREPLRTAAIVEPRSKPVSREKKEKVNTATIVEPRSKPLPIEKMVRVAPVPAVKGNGNGSH